MVEVQRFKVDYEETREYREAVSPYDSYINIAVEDSGSTTEKDIITFDIPEGYKVLVWRLKFNSDQATDITVISKSNTTETIIDKIRGKTEYDDDHERRPIYVIKGDQLIIRYVQSTAGYIFVRLFIQLVEK